MAIEKQEQARRIQDLEGRLASTHAQLGRFTQIEQALQQLKNEVVVMFDKQTEARLHAERDPSGRGSAIGRPLVAAWLRYARKFLA